MNFNVFLNNLNKLDINIKIKFKNESMFMKILGYILFFNKTFMTSYVTTIGNIIYFPSKEIIEKTPDNAINTLAHEYVHIKQSKNYTSILFSLLYLFPLSLILIFIPLGFIFHWVFFILSLLCITPLPACWRTKFEVEGYSMTLFMRNQRLIEQGLSEDQRWLLLNELADKIDKKYFRGPTYWYMWPFGVKAKLTNYLKFIVNDDILDIDETFKEIKRVYDISK